MLFGADPALAVAVLAGAPVGVARAPRSAALALALPILGLAATSETPALRYAAPALPALAAAYWGSGVVALHTGEHPRIAASRWLWTLPAGTTLADETEWEDGLPLPVRLRGGETPDWPDQGDPSRSRR